MIYTHAIAALIAAAIAATGAWQVQNWRFDARELGSLGTDPGHWTHWAPLPTFGEPSRD